MGRGDRSGCRGHAGSVMNRLCRACADGNCSRPDSLGASNLTEGVTCRKLHFIDRCHVGCCLTSKVRDAERAGEARLRDVPLDRNVRTPTHWSLRLANPKTGAKSKTSATACNKITKPIGE